MGAAFEGGPFGGRKKRNSPRGLVATRLLCAAWRAGVRDEDCDPRQRDRRQQDRQGDEAVLPDAVRHSRPDERRYTPEHQRQVLAYPLPVLDFVRGRGTGDQDGPTVIIETQLWALFHNSTVPHSSSLTRVGILTGKMVGMQTQTIERTDTDERVDDGTDSD